MRGLPSAPSGSLEAHGQVDDAPLYVDVELERGPAAALHTVIRRAEWKSAHIDGDITVATAVAQTHGRLQLQMGRLADLQHLIGVEIGGSLRGEAALNPVQGRTHAQFHLDAKDLAIAQWVGNAQLTGDGVNDALGLKLDMQLPHLGGAARQRLRRGNAGLGGAQSQSVERHGKLSRTGNFI